MRVTQIAPEVARRRLSIPTLVTCAAAGLALVVAVGLQAPAVSVGLRWQPSTFSFRPPPFRLEFSDIEFTTGTRADSSWLGWALAALIALAILYGVVQWIRHLRRPRRAPADQMSVANR